MFEVSYENNDLRFLFFDIGMDIESIILDISYLPMK